METAKHTVDAGAEAIVSPGTNPEVVEWCVKNDIPVIPGCATPSVSRHFIYADERNQPAKCKGLSYVERCAGLRWKLDCQ